YARVGVGSRGPDCVPGDWGCVKSVDFGFEDNVTLAPGESRRFVFWRLYGATGDYFAQISIQDTSNVWSNIGERADFIVSAASYAPRQLPLAFGVQWHPAWAEARDEAELALAYSTGAKVLRIGVSWRLLEPSGKGQ